MPKKNRKWMPKVIQNDTKMDEKSYFSEKAWNARNCLFYNRKPGSGYLKNHEKSVQNLCKIDVRKRHAKSMESDTKMHPKWKPKFAPGPLAAHRRGVLSLEVSALYPSRKHPFPAVGLVFAVFFFFLGGFHPGSLPFPPLSVVFWPPFGNISHNFGWKWVVVFSLCFLWMFLDEFWRVFD